MRPGRTSSGTPSDTRRSRTRRVRLVEAVTCELQNQLEQFLGLLGLEALLTRAPSTNLGRSAAMIFSFFLLIALMSEYAERSGCRPLVHDLHDLFWYTITPYVSCVNRSTIGCTLGTGWLPCLHVVVRDQVHRTGPEQRVGGDQVLEAVGLHLEQQPACRPIQTGTHPSCRPAGKPEHALVLVAQTLEIERTRPAVADLSTNRFVDLRLAERLRDGSLGARSRSARRPVKSIFSRPTDSHVGPSHWVTISFSPPPDCRYSGTTSWRGLVATITPAACTLLCGGPQ